MTTAVAGPLRWWDSHPLERQLDHLHSFGLMSALSSVRGCARAIAGHFDHGTTTRAVATRVLSHACENSVNKINNKCAKRARRDYGSLMHQSPGVPVATTRLMDSRIAAL